MTIFKKKSVLFLYVHLTQGIRKAVSAMPDEQTPGLLYTLG